jgi:hypothetical protein
METTVKQVAQYQGAHGAFYFENGEWISSDANGHDATTYDEVTDLSRFTGVIDGIDFDDMSNLRKLSIVELELPE